ncbi:MAG: DoxX family protein [Sphingomicrobium sp.]
MTNTARSPLKIALWVAQIWLLIAFGFFGAMKLTQPLAELAKMMTWIPDFPPALPRFIGAMEILGALGMVVPILFLKRPSLTAAAAIGFCLIQLLAIMLHASRGETGQTIGLNLLLLLPALFVAWGRAGSRSVEQPA